MAASRTTPVLVPNHVSPAAVRRMQLPFNESVVAEKMGSRRMRNPSKRNAPFPPAMSTVPLSPSATP